MIPDRQHILDFFSYVQPILNGSLGFIKTEGYFTHMPGMLLAMSSDETYFAVIQIPVIFNVYITAEINTFLQLKTPDVQYLENLYFVGNNIKLNSMMEYLASYNGIDDKVPCIYTEPDCYNIPGFTECMKRSDICNVRVADGKRYFVIPASKAITQAAKADTVSLKIYDNPRSPMIKTVRYNIYKKKFKLFVDIFSNILVF